MNLNAGDKQKIHMKLIFLGAPGVGKGTYASRVSPKLGIPQVSTGDLVRKEIKEGTGLGKSIKEYSDKGLLVPDKIITEMLKKRLGESDAKKGFILDGFPRTLKQARALEGITGIDLVININQKDSIIIQKIAARRVCRKCGEIYNIAHIKEGGIDMPPVLPKKEGACDKCGGELYQRGDDREEVVRERLGVYKEQTKPLTDYYRKKGLLKEITVTGPPEIMVPKIMKLLATQA